ncbi:MULTISPECIES: hypothetical protein [unclassified Gilliamella]|uniref:hypothetical protein n=1 Tax=unclassified Gilliamella TaxID=2685620 RepID=UPI0013274226|nr:MULTISPECIES: hypothetical protein [unclassified Gilliamella]MWN32817.1 hypothetical protein [Gilliamella sp. Pra-s60]MWP30254.1 hypothetical protein [Gilliamella sp. Pra-s54]
MKLKKYLSFCPLCMALMLAIVSNESRADATLNLTSEQWQKEIQQRFDAINENGEPVECVVFEYISHFPYHFDYSSLISEPLLMAVDAELVDESITAISNSSRDYQYTYNLTEKGKRYYKTWPKLENSGFCFGKVTVEKINKTDKAGNYVTVEYQYKVADFPANIEPILSKQDSYINNPSKTATATFSLDKNNQLYSVSGIGLITHIYGGWDQ